MPKQKTDNYLTGKLLVATPLVQDGYFTKSVIYIVSHNAGGATGIIVNQVIQDLESSSIFDYLNIHHAEGAECPVYFGGPVESARGFILHTDEAPYHPIALSGNVELLRKIATGNGPRKSLFVLGYTGWEAGQLDSEILENSWFIIPATEELVFGESNEAKWQQAIASLGIDLTRLSNEAGHA